MRLPARTTPGGTGRARAPAPDAPAAATSAASSSAAVRRAGAGSGCAPHGRFPSVTSTSIRFPLRSTVSRTGWPGFRERRA